MSRIEFSSELGPFDADEVAIISVGTGQTEDGETYGLLRVMTLEGEERTYALGLDMAQRMFRYEVEEES